MQLTADIFGLPTSKPHTYETSGLGAAIDVAVGLKLHPDFKTAVSEMTRKGETFKPIETNHRVYDELYRRVYCKMYDRLQPLYDEIRDINIALHLLPDLREELNASYRADFCVGYFNLRGWNEIGEHIDSWSGCDGQCVRLLVGMQQLTSR